LPLHSHITEEFNGKPTSHQSEFEPNSNCRNGGNVARVTRDTRQRAGVDPFVTTVDISKFDIKLYKFNFELRRSNMVDLEVGGLQHTSSITKDGAKIAAFYAGVLGMRLLYKSVNFDDSWMYHLAYASGVSSTSREEGLTQEELVAVRPPEGVSQRKPPCSSAAGHTFRKGGSK
jgi:Glyoxalase/Bleomycin resistance protein/Dioxygenase superfamily